MTVSSMAKAPGARLGFPSSSARGGVQPAITIYSWNEYQEGGIVAPTKGEGYLKLEGIHDVFGRGEALKADDASAVTGSLRFAAFLPHPIRLRNRFRRCRADRHVCLRSSGRNEGHR